MTETEKRILSKELCARVFYNVKCSVDGEGDEPLLLGSYLRCEDIYSFDFYFDECSSLAFRNVEEIKPYLYPLQTAPSKFIEKYNDLLARYSCLAWTEDDEINFSTELIDLFHEYHVDNRGLIDMGLARDATNKNIYSL